MRRRFYSRQYSGLCIACLSGTYKTHSGSGNCINCVANSNSAPESAFITDCTCNTGHSKIGEGECTLDKCASGSTGPLSGPCTSCLAGKYKIEEGDTECIDCLPGQYSTAVGATLNVCQNCGPGKFSIINGSDTNRCTCNARTHGPDGERADSGTET